MGEIIVEKLKRGLKKYKKNSGRWEDYEYLKGFLDTFDPDYDKKVRIILKYFDL